MPADSLEFRLRTMARHHENSMELLIYDAKTAVAECDDQALFLAYKHWLSASQALVAALATSIGRAQAAKK